MALSNREMEGGVAIVQAMGGKIERNERLDKLLTQLIEEARKQPELTPKRARELVDRLLPEELVRELLAYQLRFWVK